MFADCGPKQSRCNRPRPLGCESTRVRAVSDGSRRRVDGIRPRRQSPLAPRLLRKVLPRWQPDEINPGVNTFELKAILLVDDDKQLASALQWILADENFLVDVAFDGEEAMLKVKAHQYDAVVCDLKMPRLRGDEFYLQARELRPELSDCFIFITGFATDPHIRTFFIEQEVKFLVKPFPINGLIKCVKELLS
jgi:CheY-like chemotaxis protein